MPQDPFGAFFYLFVVLWFIRMWGRDLLEARADPEQIGKGLPGAAPCPASAIVVAVAGTLALLAAETYGEIRLGIADEQTDVSWCMLPAFVAAAFAEEFVFRGFLVVESRGAAAKWLSVVAFSALFALVHPYLWSFDWDAAGEDASLFARVAEGFSSHFTAKAFFTTAFLFAGSLWFYFVRFFRLNPHASLLAPFAAHLAKNLAVFAVKLAQGHVVSFF